MALTGDARGARVGNTARTATESVPAMTTATLTPTRLPGLRAALVRALARAIDHGLAAAPALMRPTPLAAAVVLLAACAAAVLVTLGPTAADAPALAASLDGARG
jgi:hypothetical protein